MKLYTTFSISLLLLLSSCNRCDNVAVGVVTGSITGTWQLIKIKSPKTSKSVFGYDEILKINWLSTVNSNIANETTIRDNVIFTSYNFANTNTNCSQNSVEESYTNTNLRRKYWINGNSLEATGYVIEIGSTADTLRYYYSKLP